MTLKSNNLIYPQLSYTIVGLCFDVHNELGAYAKEKQYCDLLEKRFKEIKMRHDRELRISDTGNILDFLVDKKVVLEIKAKRALTKANYYQLQRYLQISKVKLGLLVNFRNRYLSPKRVIRLDKFH